MNRRTFLTGLLASGAALSTASPVVQVLSADKQLVELLQLRLLEIEHNIVRFQQEVAHTVFYGTDETPIYYSGIRLFVDAPNDENTVWGIPE